MASTKMKQKNKIWHHTLAVHLSNDFNILAMRVSTYYYTMAGLLSEDTKMKQKNKIFHHTLAIHL